VTVHSTSTVTFRSKAVILSMGGQQELHPDFYRQFPSMIAKQDRVLLSDYFLQKEGFL